MTNLLQRKLKKGGSLQSIIDKINSNSKADFVSRLKDPNRNVIKNWENPNQVSTHKMSWATNSKGQAIVFPNIQNINGQLHDFTDPKYKHNKWDAFNSAVERGDTLMMTPQEAQQFTENYKPYYPGFEKYNSGGQIHIKKKNKGKFSAAAKRAGMSTQEYANHIMANKSNYSPTLVKRANFAKNAAGWHYKGGVINYMQRLKTTIQKDN